MVLADYCRGYCLAMRSISVTYCICVTDGACQEGRHSLPVHAGVAAPFPSDTTRTVTQAALTISKYVYHTLDNRTRTLISLLSIFEFVLVSRCLRPMATYVLVLPLSLSYGTRV